MLQDNETDNTQVYTDIPWQNAQSKGTNIPIFISCRLVELGYRVLDNWVYLFPIRRSCPIKVGKRHRLIEDGNIGKTLEGIQFLCLQLEVSCLHLQLRFSVYSCVLELSCL